MGLKAIIFQAILEVVYEKATKGESPMTLLEALTAFRSARYEDGTSPDVIVATSSKGHSVTFANPMPKTATHEDFLAAAQLLINLYRSTKTKLGGTPTDQQIFDAMVTSLQSPRRSFGYDFSYTHAFRRFA